MKILRCAATIAIAALAPTASSWGTTIGLFEGGADTPFTAETFGDAPGPSVTGPGVTGDFLLLTAAVNGQNNFVSFDRSDAGNYAKSTFSFDFIIAPDATPSADGFSFSYVNTSTYGATGGLGAPIFTPEDPAAAGVLGFGFDTWSNNAGFDDPNQVAGSDYSEISLFWDGNLISRIDDTRLLGVPLTLDDGNFTTGAGIHTATGTVDFAGGTVSLDIDGNPIFSGVSVPGLAPFESRIVLAGRTGGENENVGLDNLNVEFIPEPGAAVLGLIGFALLLMRRRRVG